MFPGNNRPFQPNMMAHPFRFSQPPPQFGPGMVGPQTQMTLPSVPPPGFPPSIPPQLNPPPLSTLPQAYGNQPISAGNQVPPRPSFPAAGSQYTAPSINNTLVNQSQIQGQGQGQFQSPSQNTLGGSGVTNQLKGSVTKMTVDFIKQFQDEVAKRKAYEGKQGKMTIPGKASQENSTQNTTKDLPASRSGPLKGILKSIVSDYQPQTNIQNKYKSSINPKMSSKVTETSKKPIVSTSQQQSLPVSGSQPVASSTGLKSILKNYETETSSSQDQYRNTTTDSSWRDTARSSSSRSQPLVKSSDEGKTGSGGFEKTSQPKGQSIPTLLRRDNKPREKRRGYSEKSEGLEDVSDDEDVLADVDPDHVQAQVFIGNLPRNVTESDIHAYLIQYPVDVWIGYYKKDSNKACAFVKLPSMKDSKKLISDIKYDRYKGQPLDVRFTAARDFTDYRVKRESREREPDQGDRFDPVEHQQMYYTQVPQYITNPGDSYSVPVYIMPQPVQATQQVFIPAGAYGTPVDMQGSLMQYGGEDYGSQSSLHDRYNRDYSPVSDRRSSTYSVYVGNLPSNLSMGSLEVYLSNYHHCGIDLKSRDGKAFAFVEFDVYEDAKDMVKDLDNKMCFGRNIRVRLAEESEISDSQNKLSWREKEKEMEREKYTKSLFQGYVDSAFANAPLLGKKYITEYLNVRDNCAVYVCSVCMEMCTDSEIAEHVVGYRHRLKCFRKDQPEIYDRMCRIRNKSTMIMECARMAADNEIQSEKITIQICLDSDERGKRHLENIKEASYVGSSKTKSKEEEKEKDKKSSSSSSGLDIFKRIAMYKKKYEETKKDETQKEETKNRGSSTDANKMSFEALSTKNRTLADSIVAEISSRQTQEDRMKIAEQTEREKKIEEERQRKLKEEKRREEEMKRKLEEARRKVLENHRKIEEEKKRKEAEKRAEEERKRKIEEERQRKIEEERQRKIAEERKRKEAEKRAGEERKRKIEEERIKEQKRKLAEEKKRMDEERRLLELKKLEEAKRIAIEAAIKKQEEIQREEEKRLEEERKVELMLKMLEEQKRAEELQKLEAQKIQAQWRHLETMKRQEEEKRQAEITRLEAERIKAEQIRLEEERKLEEQKLKEQQEKEMEEIKKRHKKLQMLQEAEEKRQRLLMASQKRATALKRVEESKQSKEQESVTITSDLPAIFDQKYYDEHEMELTFEQKLIPIRKRAYINLPFSMEEKKLFLKTNISPDEKIGPHEKSKIDSVLAMKYNMKGSEFPLIGLQYIVEGYEGKDDRVIHKYFCECCCIESMHCDAILQHLIGYTHRSKYLQLHKSDVHMKLMQQDLRRSTLNQLLKKEAMKIEEETGRFQIPTLTMSEYQAYVKKMKQIETAYRDPSPQVSENAANIKQVINMSERGENAHTDKSCYDPTLNVQGIVNRTLAMACEITFPEGHTWVDFYKYLNQKKLTNDPMLGLQYITEVRGNKKYSPKYTCSLCDIPAISWPQDIYSHIQSIAHLERYLNLLHPEKIQENETLTTRVLSRPEYNKILRDIAYKVGSEQKQKENIKVGVLLVENVWRTWHEQIGKKAKKQKVDEMEVCTDAKALKLKPQIYDVLRQYKEVFCGLDSLTEVQSDMALTYYICSLCDTQNVNQKNIFEHLRGKKHRRMYWKKKKLGTVPGYCDMDDIIRTTITPGGEAITVKKVLYLDIHGQTVFSDPEIMKDPLLSVMDKTTEEAKKNVESNTETKQTEPKSADEAEQSSEKNSTEAAITDKEKAKTPSKQRSTKFDKIVKGLDYTPLLGIEYMTEVQNEKGDCQPKFECSLCNQTGKHSNLSPKNILRHIGTKGHRLSYIQKQHNAAYKDIKSSLGKFRGKKLDQYTKEIGSKFGRAQIRVRVETDPLFWDPTKDPNQKPAEDEVIITRVEPGPSKQTDEKNAESASPTDPKDTSDPQESDTIKEPLLNLEQLSCSTEEEASLWQKENEKIREGMENGLFVPSSRCSRFVAEYNATFCSYPIIGLQWMTEFHREQSVTWWCVCRLCEEKIIVCKKLSSHISSMKHRLRYIQKKYPSMYASLKKEHFTVTMESMLRQKVYKHSQEIMKTEGREFKPEVLLEKSAIKLIVSEKKKTGVIKIPTVSPKVHSGAAQNYHITKSQSANIQVITTVNTDVNIGNKASPQKRSSVSDPDSDPVTKKLRLESMEKNITSDIKKPESDTNLMTHNTKEVDIQQGDESDNQGDSNNDVIIIEDEDQQKHSDETHQEKNKSGKTGTLRKLKRKLDDDPEIQTKTLDLKRDSFDTGDEEGTKMKRSKIDHKSRSYRDNYGSSYGHGQDTKHGSRSKESRSKGSNSKDSRSKDSRSTNRSRSRHRSRSRNRSPRKGRRSDRDRSKKSSSRDNKGKSRTSRRKDEEEKKGKVHEKIKANTEKKPNADAIQGVEEKEKVHNSDEEEDFDAFIMGQLGEDFVTVDEVEEMEEDFVTLDEIAEEAIAEKEDNQMNSEPDTEFPQAEKVSTENIGEPIGKSAEPSELSEESSQLSKINEKNGNETSVESTTTDRIEVSVILDQEKTPEKSKSSMKNSVNTGIGRMIISPSVQIEIDQDSQLSQESQHQAASQDSEEVKDREQEGHLELVVEPVPAPSKQTVCPFLGIPVVSIASQSESGKENSQKQGIGQDVKNLFDKPSKETIGTASIIVEVDGSSDKQDLESKFDSVDLTSGGFVTIDVDESDKISTDLKKSENNSSITTKTDNELKNDQKVTLEGNILDKSSDKTVAKSGPKTGKTKDEQSLKDPVKPIVSKPPEAVPESTTESPNSPEQPPSTNKGVKRKSARVGNAPVAVSTRQTRSSRQRNVSETHVTMEIDDANPQSAKSGAKKTDNKDKKKKECEVSIQIG